MNQDSALKPALRAGLVVLFLASIVALTYRVRGTNWAAGVGTAVGVSLWLWSARRSHRARGPEVGPRLVVDRLGALCDEDRPRLSHRRLRVANTGTQPLEHVEVTLIKCSPTPAWFEAVRLQRLHGGAHPFELRPHTEVYVEIVALPYGHPEFIIVHDSAAHGGLPNGLGTEPLELTVQVAAHGVDKALFRFTVSRSAAGKLELIPEGQPAG